MNWKTTLALLVLGAAGLAAWYTVGTLPYFEKQPPAPPAAQAPLLDPAKLSRIVIERPDGKVTFTRAGSEWRLDGGWATRPGEMRRLLDALGSLRSRFAPLAVEKFEPRVSVVVTTPEGERRLAFAESTEGGRFDRPTLVRVGDAAEVQRFAPGLVALLDRPADFYQQRRIFPSRRELKDETGTARVERLDARGIAISEKGEQRVALSRVLDTWEMSYPLRDALDPRGRDLLLEAAADLWVEKFVDAPADFRVERSVSVTRTDGSTLTLEIGPTQLGGEKAETRPRAVARLAGQSRYFEVATDKFNDLFPSVLDTLRDAQLVRFRPEDVRSLTIDLPTGPITLTNAKPRGREATSETPPGMPPPSTADWRLSDPKGELKADNAAVDRLLTTLSTLATLERDAGLRVQLGAAVASIGIPSLATPWFAAPRVPGELLGLDKPAATLTLQIEEGPLESPRKQTRTLVLGRHRADAGKLYATSNGFPRINEIGDELVAQVVGKTALDFRGKKLLELSPESLATLRIERRDLPAAGLHLIGLTPWEVLLSVAPSGETLALERTPSGWNLTAPVKTTADTALADALARRLATLEVVTFVGTLSDKAAPAEVIRFGFDAPMVKAIFGTETLLVGRPRETGGGWYARRANQPEVFVLGNDLVDLLRRDSLGYRPASLWTVAADDPFVEFAFDRGKDEPTFRLVRKKDADTWEVVGPFTVPVPPAVIDALTQTLTAPRASRFVTHAAKDLQPFGLATPRTTLTMKTKSGKTFTLRLGAESGAGRYAKLDEASVFEVESTLARAADRTALDFLDRNLLRLNPATLTGLTRTVGTETLEVVKTDDGWQMRKPSMQVADEQKVPELLGRVGTLAAGKLVAYAPKSVATYGLDKPHATLTLLPGKETVLIGSEVAGTGERHVQIQGQPVVGLLDAETTARLLASPLTLRDHRLARVPDADTMTLTAGDRVVTFGKPEGTWKVTVPLAAEADHDAMEAFLNSLSRLRADAFVAEKPDAATLKKFGLEKPTARWSLKLDDKVVLDLSVGAPETDGRRYARLAGNDTVFLLEAKVAEQAVREYRPRAVLTGVDPAQIESVRFGYREGAFTLVRMGADWQVQGQPEIRLNQAAVTEALATLRDLKLERYVRDDKAALKLYGLDPVELVLEVVTPSGRRVLHLGGIEGSSKRRYARLPASKAADVFVLDEATSEKLVRPLAGFRAPAIGAKDSDSP
jgi:hypothetical protein